MDSHGQEVYDAIIVGAGPAGLSAALILGRCRRRVLIFDDGKPRNEASHALHGFLTRDGIQPAELLRIAREQLEPYNVAIKRTHVLNVNRMEYGFEVILGDGSHLHARKVLLATGLIDRIPKIEGLEPLYGTSVFHCPFCDGWEVRDQAIAALREHGADVRRMDGARLDELVEKSSERRVVVALDELLAGRSVVAGREEERESNR